MPPMTLTEISALIGRGLSTSSFTDSLKFDCGADGVIVIADCTLSISRENLQKLIFGKLNPMTGVMMGKLKVSGDATVALKLGQLLKA